MKKYALIGKNIQDSLSPVIHGAYGCQYDLLDVEEDKLEWALSLPYDGFNVTSPYKEKIRKFVYADNQPLNVLKRFNEGWMGYNTDGTGFLRACAKANALVIGDIGIVGNGGASIIIQRKLGYQCKVINGRDYAAWELEDLVGLVNCTPFQNYNLEGLPKNAWVMDLGYKDDTFIKNARTRGNFAFNGMGMLIAQAEESQRIWNS